MITFDLDATMDIQMDLSQKEDVEVTLENVTEVVTNDYEKLNNLPTLDGELIIKDIKEKDPTVPGYIKEGYGLDGRKEIPYSHIYDMWKQVFSN